MGQDTQKAINLDKKAAKVVAPDIHYDLLLTSDSAKEVNAKLGNLEGEILEIQREFEKEFKKNQKPYSSKMVIDKLNESKAPVTKKEFSSNNIPEFIDQYVDENAPKREPWIITVKEKREPISL